jgi:Raf kinase inhibitor-like YbhB/YbcL family protein
MSMQLTSPDFINGGEIPQKFTCDGDNVSPNLEIRGVPANARTLAFVLDDPDAPSGTFSHWVIWNIPPITDKIVSGSLPVGACEGLNSLGKIGYVGPCPPSGMHNYIFTLYALDTSIEDLDPSYTDRKTLHEKLTGHIIATSELIGLYKKLE